MTINRMLTVGLFGAALALGAGLAGCQDKETSRDAATDVAGSLMPNPPNYYDVVLAEQDAKNKAALAAETPAAPPPTSAPEGGATPAVTPEAPAGTPATETPAATSPAAGG